MPEKLYFPVPMLSLDSSERRQVTTQAASARSFTHCDPRHVYTDAEHEEVQKLIAEREALRAEAHEAVQSDFEHGVKCLNEIAALEFKTKYPKTYALLGKVMSGGSDAAK